MVDNNEYHIFDPPQPEIHRFSISFRFQIGFFIGHIFYNTIDGYKWWIFQGTWALSARSCPIFASPQPQQGIRKAGALRHF
jgi:hypothetical protein